MLCFTTTVHAWTQLAQWFAGGSCFIPVIFGISTSQRGLCLQPFDQVYDRIPSNQS